MSSFVTVSTQLFKLEHFTKDTEKNRIFISYVPIHVLHGDHDRTINKRTFISSYLLGA